MRRSGSLSKAAVADLTIAMSDNPTFGPPDALQVNEAGDLLTEITDVAVSFQRPPDDGGIGKLEMPGFDGRDDKLPEPDRYAIGNHPDL